MGLRGPKPAPTAIKIAKGERRPSRVNHSEPAVPPVASMAAPAGLVGAGLVEWNRVAQVLSDAGALKETDMAALEDYCRALTDLRTYEAKAKRARPELAIAKGYTGAVIKLRAQVATLRAPLGLTPSSRGGIRVAPLEKKQDEDDAKYFGGGPRGIVSGRK